MCYGKNTPCPICGKIMVLDDIDTIKPGSQNEWWICDNNNCCVARYIEVRNYNVTVSYYFNDGINMAFNVDKKSQ